MLDIKKYKIGMRTFKTGLAVALSVFISELFNLKSPNLVAIAAIVSMQSSVNESFIAGKNRMLGTFIGAIVGLVFSFLLPHNYFFLGLGIIVVIHIHHLLDWKQSLSLSAIVFVAIFLYQEDYRFDYAAHRLLDTFIGIIVSMLINYFIATPDNKKSFVFIKNNIYALIKHLIYYVITDVDKMREDFFIEELEEYTHTLDALKNELSKDSSHSSSAKSASHIVELLERVEVNLATLVELDIVPILNEDNIKLFNQLYSKEEYFEAYRPPERNFTDMDIIYNYHANKIFNKLLNLERELC